MKNHSKGSGSESDRAHPDQAKDKKPAPPPAKKAPKAKEQVADDDPLAEVM